MKKDVVLKTELPKYLQNYKITYLDENEYRKLLKGLKKVNMLAYKQICFDILRNENFNKQPGKHEISLKTNKDFKKVYGDIRLIYSIVKDTILIENIEPSNVLIEYHKREKNMYKGIPFIDKKDIFKINLLKEMEK